MICTALLSIPCQLGDALAGTEDEPANFPFRFIQIGEVAGMRMIAVIGIEPDVATEFITAHPTIVPIGMWDKGSGLQVGTAYKQAAGLESIPEIVGSPLFPFNKEEYLKFLADIIDDEGNATRPTEVGQLPNWCGSATPQI